MFFWRCTKDFCAIVPIFPQLPRCFRCISVLHHYNRVYPPPQQTINQSVSKNEQKQCTPIMYSLPSLYSKGFQCSVSSQDNHSNLQHEATAIAQSELEGTDVSRCSNSSNNSRVCVFSCVPTRWSLYSSCNAKATKLIGCYLSWTLSLY